MTLQEALAEMKIIETLKKDFDPDYGDYLLEAYKEYSKGTPIFDLWHDLEMACSEFTVTEYKNNKY